MLEKVDLTLTLSKEEYKARLPVLQQRIFELQSACWKNAVASVFVFEGWDASGVGSCLNLLTEKLEPRGFRLHAIRAARTYETHMPWLARFWRRIPAYGQLAIFDKSWYRRVLDERVEKIVSKAECEKACLDIAGFERTLADDGYVIRKFFFHISKKEQKKRFKKSERDPMDAWHVTPEWWDQHRKYSKYADAAEEMFAKTDGEWAPWTVIEASDERWARIKAFENIVQALETALKNKGVELPAASAAVPAPKPANSKPAKKNGKTAAAKRS